MPDYPNAVWLPSAHLLQGRGGVLPKWIVLHVRNMTLAQTCAALDEAGHSYHYLLDEQTILQMVSEEQSANAGMPGRGHAPFWDHEIQHYHHNPNYFTYHVGVALHGEQPTPQLRATLYGLLDDLLTRHQMPHQFNSPEGGVTLSATWGEYWPDFWPLNELQQAVETGTWDLVAEAPPAEPEPQLEPVAATPKPRRKKKETV